jgi:hypothetical protein
MFMVLGATLELRSRRALAFNVIGSAAAISAALWLLHPEVAEYRGLSGIDSALFLNVALVLLFEAHNRRQALLSWALGLLLVGFTAKLGNEMASGATLFVDSSEAGFTPLPLVHAVGAAVGILLALPKRQHVVAKFFHSFDWHRVVDRRSNPADRPVTFQVD